MARQVAVAREVAHRAAQLELVRAGRVLEQARQVEVRVGDRAIELERALVRGDRLGAPAAIFERDAEVEPVQRDVIARADREPVQRFGIAELAAIVVQPAEVVVGVGEIGTAGDRAAVCRHRAGHVAILEREAALVVIDRRGCPVHAEPALCREDGHELSHVHRLAMGSDMEPVTTFVIEASGRDLRVPADTYRFVALDEVDRDLLAAVVEPDVATVVRRATDHGGHIDNDIYIVVPVAGPWSIVDVGGERRGVRASEHGGRWFTVLEGALDDWPDALPATTFVLGTDGSIWDADAWQLRPHPVPIASGRDWRWRGIATSFGPHVISLVIDASEAELARFWAGCAPVPRPDDDDSFARRAFTLTEGRFSIARGASDPGPHVAAFDRGVLCALARGAAGPLRWWHVLEQDWGQSYALGDDGASLIDYLCGDAAIVEAEQARLLAPYEIDLAAVQSSDDLAAALASRLGAHDRIDDAAFDGWLAARAVAELPRVVAIAVPRGELERWAHRLHAAQPFIAWRVIGR